MLKPTITFDDYSKLDVRIGQVIAAEDIAKQNGYIKLDVNFGPEIGTRTCITNLGKSGQYHAHDFLRLSFPFVLNFEPRTVAKHVSNCMILAAMDEHTSSYLVSSDRGTPGAVVI